MQVRCFSNPPTNFRNAINILNKCKSGIFRAAPSSGPYPDPYSDGSALICFLKGSRTKWREKKNRALPPSLSRHRIDIANKCKSGVFRTRRLAIAVHLLLIDVYVHVRPSVSGYRPTPAGAGGWPGLQGVTAGHLALAAERAVMHPGRRARRRADRSTQQVNSTKVPPPTLWRSRLPGGYSGCP